MKTTFTLESARELLPQVKRVTADAAIRVARIAEEMNKLEDDDPRLTELDRRVRKLVADWVNVVEKLGAETKGLWLVDFDSGGGYYCWQHPEEDLEFFHTYEAGFAGREPIAPEMLH
jgi:hypothetical protein